MAFDIDKSQLSELGKTIQPKEIRMTKAEVIKELLSTREINTGMLKILGMPFDIWLRYCNLGSEAKKLVVDKALSKLGVSPTFCDVCECDPCDCGYGS